MPVQVRRAREPFLVALWTNMCCNGECTDEIQWANRVKCIADRCGSSIGIVSISQYVESGEFAHVVRQCELIYAGGHAQDVQVGRAIDKMGNRGEEKN